MSTIALCSDSNGTTAYVSEEQLYIRLIANGLGFESVNNYSVSGKRSDEIVAQVQQALADGCDLIVVNAGTNDISQTYGGSVASIISNICASVSSMISAVTFAGKSIMVMSPILPLDQQYVERHVAVERALCRLCHERGVDFIPVISWMNDRAFTLSPQQLLTYYTIDKWHGTTVWHAAVAEFVLSRKHTQQGGGAVGQAKVGAFVYDLSGGPTQSIVSGLGFRPTSLQAFAAPANGVTASSGFSDGVASRCVVMGQGGVDGFSYANNLLYIMPSGGYAYADVVFTNDGFVLTWGKSGSPSGAYYIEYLARS